MNFFKHLHLAYFSKPAFERPLYRLMRARKPARIVEIGVGNGRRAVRLIRVAQRYAGQVRYTGIDLFEGRPPHAPGLTLKLAHRTLARTGARIQLIPGETPLALARYANGLARTDLVVVSADQNPADAWFYVPRMLSEHATIIVERPGALEVLSREELRRLAARRAA